MRLRLCDQDTSEPRLLQAMYGYTINASFKSRNWNPYGEPLPPDAALGRPGAPSYPVSASRFETVAEPVAQPRRTVSRRADNAAAAGTPPARPAPLGPLIPPPPGDELAAASKPGPTGSPAPAPVSGAPLVPPPPL